MSGYQPPVWDSPLILGYANEGDDVVISVERRDAANRFMCIADTDSQMHPIFSAKDKVHISFVWRGMAFDASPRKRKEYFAPNVDAKELLDQFNAYNGQFGDYNPKSTVMVCLDITVPFKRGTHAFTQLSEAIEDFRTSPFRDGSRYFESVSAEIPPSVSVKAILSITSEGLIASALCEKNTALSWSAPFTIGMLTVRLLGGFNNGIPYVATVVPFKEHADGPSVLSFPRFSLMEACTELASHPGFSLQADQDQAANDDDDSEAHGDYMIDTGGLFMRTDESTSERTARSSANGSHNLLVVYILTQALMGNKPFGQILGSILEAISKIDDVQACMLLLNSVRVNDSRVCYKYSSSFRLMVWVFKQMYIIRRADSMSAISFGVTRAIYDLMVPRGAILTRGYLTNNLQCRIIERENSPGLKEAYGGKTKSTDYFNVPHWVSEGEYLTVSKFFSKQKLRESSHSTVMKIIYDEVVQVKERMAIEKKGVAFISTRTTIFLFWYHNGTVHQLYRLLSKSALFDARIPYDGTSPDSVLAYIKFMIPRYRVSVID